MMRGVNNINNHLRMKGENNSLLNSSSAQEESKTDIMNTAFVGEQVNSV